MLSLITKYGKLALALIAIFLSGQAIGWMLAWHSCEARPHVPADPDRWAAHMMARLREDLRLSDAQVPAVQARLDAASSKLQHTRDAALFQIHLELIKLHDDLVPGLTEDQKNKLATSRRNLVDSTAAKFPEFLRRTAVPPAPPESTTPTPP